MNVALNDVYGGSVLAASAPVDGSLAQQTPMPADPPGNLSNVSPFADLRSYAADLVGPDTPTYFAPMNVALNEDAAGTLPDDDDGTQTAAA